MLRLPEQTAPGTPDTGYVALYAANGNLYAKDDAGNERLLGSLSGLLSGLRTSVNGSDTEHDIDVASGVATDSSGMEVMMLGSAITKRIDASWVVGTNQGGLDTGSVANSTLYYMWLIKRSDTGVVDVLFSTSYSAPTMPANYDYKRLIGALRTDTSANIIRYYQVNDWFYYTNYGGAPVTLLHSGTATTETSLQTVLDGAVPPIAAEFDIMCVSVITAGIGVTITDVYLSPGVLFGPVGSTYSTVDATQSIDYGYSTRLPRTGYFAYRNNVTVGSGHSSYIYVRAFRLPL